MFKKVSASLEQYYKNSLPEQTLPLVLCFKDLDFFPPTILKNIKYYYSFDIIKAQVLAKDLEELLTHPKLIRASLSK